MFLKAEDEEEYSVWTHGAQWEDVYEKAWSLKFTPFNKLVALVRAWIANPDLLVLDEATSAVDPALEVQLRRAIERLTAGRTSITIAHRLATAEAADEVLVFDRGRLVERGPHAELVAQGGRYAALHRDWEGVTARA